MIKEEKEIVVRKICFILFALMYVTSIVLFDKTLMLFTFIVGAYLSFGLIKNEESLYELFFKKKVHKLIDKALILAVIVVVLTPIGVLVNGRLEGIKVNKQIKSVMESHLYSDGNLENEVREDVKSITSDLRVMSVHRYLSDDKKTIIMDLVVQDNTGKSKVFTISE